MSTAAASAPGNAGAPLVVRTLVGHRWAKVGRFALKVLREAAGAPLRLVAHTDGTVTPAIRADYEAWAGPIEWVDGADVEARIAAALRRHPRCAAYRARHALARKLFDVVLLADEPEVVYVDSDVRFLRAAASWLREPLPAGVGGRFSAQPPGDEALAADPRDAAPCGPLRLAARLNTGLFRVRRELLDLDRVEAMLGVLERRPRAAARVYWLEQTLWAGLAAAGAAELWDFRAVTIPPVDDRLAVPREGVSAVHCVGPVRLAFWKFKHETLGPEQRPGTVPVQTVTPWALALSDLRRGWNRRPGEPPEGGGPTP